MRILITDDSAFMRNMLKNVITQQYPDVIIKEATNGEEAVSIYKIFKPNLVFMDITMNIMNGIEATKLIKIENNKAAIVMVSAMGQSALVVESITAGAMDFIVKPFDRQKILDSIKKFIS